MFVLINKYVIILGNSLDFLYTYFLKVFGLLGSKPVFIPFSDSQCVFLEDSRRHCIYLKQYWKIPELSRSI